ncbi:UNVERIFIED_CONTAM: endo-1,4-beta-xylanase [Acetivibrio alkalicellulosi]
MSAFIVCLMCFTNLFAIELHAQIITGNSFGIHDGYDYELWGDWGSGGTMTLKDGGTFDCQWDNINSILFRKGRVFDETQTHQQMGNISIRYDVDYNSNGFSFLCVYGWTVDPLIEYYIVESWDDWRPPGGALLGQITVDGGTYEIFNTRARKQTKRGIETFEQYWSVRTEKRTSGTISVSQHFAAWERMNMPMGKMTEVALAIEGWQSKGRADVHTNVLTIGGALPTPVPIDIRYGDINGDGVIDSKDYILLRRYILQVRTSLPNRIAADLNGDGNIDSIDVILLRRYILGIINKNPNENMVTPTQTPSGT